MRKETIVWQAIVLSVGFLVGLSLREYLLDKNEIEAKVEHAKCILDAKKMGADTLYPTCNDIKLYKLKFNK